MEIGILLVGGRLRPVDLRVDQDMREEEVVVAHMLVIIARVFAVFRLELAVVAGGEAPAGHVGVHEVGGASHQPEIMVGAELEVAPPLREILARTRHQERGRDGLAGLGRRKKADVAVRFGELQIVLFHDRAQRPAKGWMRRDVLDAFAVQKDNRLVRPEGLSVLLARPCAHDRPRPSCLCRFFDIQEVPNGRLPCQHRRPISIPPMAAIALLGFSGVTCSLYATEPFPGRTCPLLDEPASRSLPSLRT